MTSTTPSVDDVITAEVIRGALLVAAEEASIVVVRAAHSTFIQEGADACAAILDADAQLVALSTATSLMHAASLRCSLPAAHRGHPARHDAAGRRVRDERPVPRRDPRQRHPRVPSGVRRRPRAVYFAGTLIHVADVGGVSAGGLAALATDTFAEGLMLPPVHLYRQGEPARDVLRIIEGNSRTPDKAIGDVHALVAGVNVIGRRLDELIERYGAGPLARFTQEWLDGSERRMRDELRRLPAGTYHGSFTIEGDGFVEGRRYEVHAAVTLDDGAIDIDFTGTSQQSGGAINASFSQTMSGVIYAVRCLVDPSIPMNEGCFRAVRMQLPRGTLVNPNPPAACGGRVISVTAAIEAVLAALAQARPRPSRSRRARSSTCTRSPAVGADGRRWVSLFYDFGGIGGRHGVDGPDATGCYFLGGRSVIPQIEPLEAQYPFVVRRSRLLPDSGGTGQWRGGLGTEIVVEMLAPAELTVRGDRIELPPPGVDGGGAGRARRVRGGARRREHRGAVDTSRSASTSPPGDRFVMRTSGGGGLGPPEARAPRRGPRRRAERPGHATREAVPRLPPRPRSDE